MQGLDLTIETLGKSRNSAAVDVLVAALDSPSDDQRSGALQALICRKEQRAADLLLSNWDKLKEQDVEIIRGSEFHMQMVVERALDIDNPTDQIEEAISAAESLNLASVLPQLISITETIRSESLRVRAGEAVKRIAEKLGSAARNEKDQPSVRHPVLALLTKSLHRHSSHHNDDLVEAFLLASTWNDREIRQVMGDQSPEFKLIQRKLIKSTHPGILELLTECLKRRELPAQIVPVILKRDDPCFRNALLKSIGSDPTQAVLRNLRETGMPRCCIGHEAVFEDLPPDCIAALAHVHVACNQDYVETLHLIALTAEQGTRENMAAAAIALLRCEVPNELCWMRAALEIAESEPESNCLDETARLLQRLVELLDYPDTNLNRSLRIALSTLHAPKMLPHFEPLRSRSRRRLGYVVMKVDPDAIYRVRDALRHPVLKKRLQAIAMADAFDAVDLLYESFEHICREDHQEARIRAAEAMVSATSQATLRLLQEMAELPSSPVRDAAAAAIQARETSADLSRVNTGGLPS